MSYEILIEKLKEFHESKVKSDGWDKTRKLRQSACVELFENLPELEDTTEFDYGEGMESYKATCVKSETIKIDEEGLKEKLGSEIWEQVTTSKLDMKKLESLVATGAIASEVIADYSTIVPRTPYVKIGIKKSS